MNGTGKRVIRGRTMPGYCVEWRESGRHRTKVFTLKKMATQFMRALTERFERESADGLLPVTMRDASREYLLSIETLSDSVKGEYATMLGLLAAQVGQDRPVARVTTADIEEYLRARSTWNRKGETRKTSESTLAKHYSYLRRFFHWAAKRGYCTGTPTEGVTVKPVAGAKELAALPTDEDIARLIDAIDDTRMKVAAMIGLTTGLDRGVVASLKAQHFNLGERTITAQRRKTRRSNPGNLVVPIHGALITPLRQLFDRTLPARPLFPGYMFRAWYRNARQAAGAPWTELTVADFRKIASGRSQRVMPLTSVQRMLGHSSALTTSRHYSPVDPAAQQAFDRLTLPILEDTPPETQPKSA